MAVGHPRRLNHQVQMKSHPGKRDVKLVNHLVSVELENNNHNAVVMEQEGTALTQEGVAVDHKSEVVEQECEVMEQEGVVVEQEGVAVIWYTRCIARCQTTRDTATNSNGNGEVTRISFTLLFVYMCTLLS